MPKLKILVPFCAIGVVVFNLLGFGAVFLCLRPIVSFAQSYSMIAARSMLSWSVLGVAIACWVYRSCYVMNWSYTLQIDKKFGKYVPSAVLIYLNLTFVAAAPEFFVVRSTILSFVISAVVAVTGTYTTQLIYVFAKGKMTHTAPVLLRALTHPASIESVAFHPDGVSLVCLSSDGSILFRDTVGHVEKVSTGIPKQMEGLPMICSITKDGRTVAVGAWGYLGALDYNTRKLLWEIRDNSNFSAISIIDDCNTIACCGTSSKQIRLFDVRSGTLKGTITVERPQSTNQASATAASFNVNCITFAPGATGKAADEMWVGGGSTDYAKKTSWGFLGGYGDGYNWQVQPEVVEIASIAVSQDGKCCAIAPQYLALIVADSWGGIADNKTRKMIYRPVARARGILFAPNGQLLGGYFDDLTARLWNVATGNLVCTLFKHDDHVRSLAFSPNGKVVATSTRKGTVTLWDISKYQA